MKGILKWPLIIAAVVVVLRVVLEQAGVSDTINNILGIWVLTVLICPVYFAIRIGQSGLPRPYITHFKLTALYAVLVRLMVLPTYWLARIYDWPQSRFAGLAGPDVSPFTGFVAIPVGTALIWIVMSVVVGGALGFIVIPLTRKFAGKPAVGVSVR